MRHFVTLLLLLLTNSVASAQTFELVEIDGSVTPSPVHFRIKLPHQGFHFLRYGQIDYNNLPPTIVAAFLFKECKGTLTPIYYDTTIYMYLYTNDGQALRFYTLVDSNTTDTNCIIRYDLHATDTFLKQFPYLGIAQVGKLSIRLYPNPVKDSKIHIELAGTSAGLQEVFLYGMEGKRIAPCNYSATDKTIRLPAGIFTGNYILEIIFNNGQRERRQVVVE